VGEQGGAVQKRTFELVEGRCEGGEREGIWKGKPSTRIDVDQVPNYLTKEEKEDESVGDQD